MFSPRLPEGSVRVIAEIARAPEEGMRARRRLLVLAAHPDDESLGASAALGRCATSAVAFLADGATRDARFRPGWSGSRETYAQARRQEGLAALALVHVPPDSIFWMGGTDQETIYELDRLITRFADIIAQFAPEVVITHPYEGGHPDHDAAALVASAAIGRSHGGQEAVLREFPLEPERLRPAPAYDFTRPPHAGPLWYECLGWPLTGEQWRQNAALLLSHS
jgi:LmbE family N-acetylglucosaminyl deacetylase